MEGQISVYHALALVRILVILTIHLLLLIFTQKIEQLWLSDDLSLFSLEGVYLMIENFISSSSELPSILDTLVSKWGVQCRNDSLFETHEETEQLRVSYFSRNHSGDQKRVLCCQELLDEV